MTAFAELLSEAVEAADSVELMERPESMMLSAQAFVAEALRIAKIDRAEAGELRGRIMGDSTLENLAGAVRRGVSLITGRLGGRCSRPPTQANRLRFLLGEAGEAELGVAGINLFEMFAVSALIAVEQAPEAFGICTDYDSHQRGMKAAKDRLDELCSRIEAEVAGEDLAIDASRLTGRERDAGLRHVSYKVSGGAVTLGQDSAPELVRWLQQNRSAIHGDVAEPVAA